jgi:5-methylcytosine-specific restriction protein A
LKKLRQGKPIERNGPSMRTAKLRWVTTFLLKQGKEPRGIMASGAVVGGPVLRPHWDPEKKDTSIHEVMIEFDTVLEPAAGAILPRDLLNTGALAHVHWNAEWSGNLIEPIAAAELEQLWAEWIEKRATVGQKIRVYFDGLFAGEAYDRPELAKMWGYKDWHAIGRGIVTPAGHKLVMLFVTKEKQDALTQYNDHFEGDLLHMEGETNHAADQRLINARTNGDSIYLFYRDHHHTSFVYYGPVELRSYELNQGDPSRFIFTTGKSEAAAASAIAAEQRTHGGVDEDFVPDAEGRRSIRQHVMYERSARNRARALEIHGSRCLVCGFDFNGFYGAELARDYIEVHHTKSITELDGKVLNPETDMAPLCSNCHSMAHRNHARIISIEELRDLVRSGSLQKATDVSVSR